MIENKLKKIMSDILEVSIEEIDTSTSMENTETWDSLKHMELVVCVEENFGFEYSSEEMMNMTSYKAILESLKLKEIKV